MKHFIMIILTVMILSQGSVAVSAELPVFADVPKGHWAQPAITQLKALGISNGVGNNNFGLGQTMNRAEFVTFLVRLMGWDEMTPETGSYVDNADSDAWYYRPVETAVSKGVIDTRDRHFRPLAFITREEMAVMIVNTLGYAWLAESKAEASSPFTDVTTHMGYMTLLSDFGIVKGKGQGLFAPEDTAKREEAAAILMRMYKKTTADTDELNGFYAVSSYQQIKLMDRFDAMSFGWASLAYSEESKQVVMIINRPDGYEEPIDLAKSLGLHRRLSIYGSNLKGLEDGSGIIDGLISHVDNRQVFIEAIVTELKASDDFDGVVIDFEELIGEASKENLNLFLRSLSLELKAMNKSLTVMVHPNDYYTGYDYRTIGSLVDQVILMAHDYSAKSLTEYEQKTGYVWTPLAPIEDVYKALKSVTDRTHGVEDTSKISLQVSFASAQWGIDEKGYVVNNQPYVPAYDKIVARLLEPDTTIFYDPKSKNPFAEYKNETEGVDYRIWYEDSRSISEKLALARMFDVTDVSVWRLGNIPDYSDAPGKAVNMNVMDILSD